MRTPEHSRVKDTLLFPPFPQGTERSNSQTNTHTQTTCVAQPQYFEARVQPVYCASEHAYGKGQFEDFDGTEHLLLLPAFFNSLRNPATEPKTL